MQIKIVVVPMCYFILGKLLSCSVKTVVNKKQKHT